MYKIFYVTVLIWGCGYALWRGGAPERWGAGVVLAGMILANVAAIRSQHLFLATDTMFILVDIVVAIALIALACTADRFWPIWAAMLQLDAVFTHLVMYAQTTPPFSYGLALRLFALPLPILVGIGALRFRRRTAAAARIVRGGAAPDRGGQPSI